MPQFAVILPAAGKSSRFREKEKKPFTNLDGRAVWLRSVEHFVTRKDQPDIPLELETEIEAQPPDQPGGGGTPRKKAFVLGPGERPDMNTDLVLPVPHRAADDGVLPEP